MASAATVAVLSSLITASFGAWFAGSAAGEVGAVMGRMLVGGPAHFRNLAVLAVAVKGDFHGGKSVSHVCYVVLRDDAVPLEGASKFLCSMGPVPRRT